MALFLLSDAAGHVTGQVINVDGGHGLRRGADISSLIEPVFGAEALRGVVRTQSCVTLDPPGAAAAAWANTS